jgi:hypothetical protein
MPSHFQSLLKPLAQFFKAASLEPRPGEKIEAAVRLLNEREIPAALTEILRRAPGKIGKLSIENSAIPLPLLAENFLGEATVERSMQIRHEKQILFLLLANSNSVPDSEDKRCADLYLFSEQECVLGLEIAERSDMGGGAFWEVEITACRLDDTTVLTNLKMLTKGVWVDVLPLVARDIRIGANAVLRAETQTISDRIKL